MSPISARSISTPCLHSDRDNNGDDSVSSPLFSYVLSLVAEHLSLVYIELLAYRLLVYSAEDTIYETSR